MVQVRNQKYGRMLLNIYFHIYLVATFGEVFLWMIATLATSQNWPKKKCVKPHRNRTKLQRRRRKAEESSTVIWRTKSVKPDVWPVCRPLYTRRRKRGEGEDKIRRQHPTRDQDHTQHACGQNSQGSCEIGDCTSFCVACSTSRTNRNCRIFKCGTGELHGSCSSLLSLHHDFVLRLRWVCFEGLFGDSGSRGEDFRFATGTAQGQAYRLHPQWCRPRLQCCRVHPQRWGRWCRFHPQWHRLYPEWRRLHPRPYTL